MDRLEALRRLVFATDNRACFAEREQILDELAVAYEGYNGPDKYARILAQLLERVSTPVGEWDYFGGRVVEEVTKMTAPNLLLCSLGHMSPDYEKLLRVGLKGILEEICRNARQKGDPDALSFAENARIVVDAIHGYALRYAAQAQRCGKEEMARALRTVPYEPAYDFYSALQSIWIIHMIASCYVGARDYAFGKFDRYMQPYYAQALAEGKSREELTQLLAGFFVKTNEICGRTTHNYQCKPVLCQASKQYVTIGGEHPNDFSIAVLDAAMTLNLPQPQIIVMLKPEADEAFTRKTFEALALLTDKMHIYHFQLIYQALTRKGIPAQIAGDATFSACCTLDLDYHNFRMEYYAPVPQVFVQTLHSREFSSVEEILQAFTEAMRRDFQAYADKLKPGKSPSLSRRQFVLDGLLLSDSAVQCRYAGDGKAPYHLINLFCPGIATLGDSLMVLDKLVFREKRFTYAQFQQILRENYAGYEQLQSEIRSYVRFGNDTDSDRYAVMAGNALADAVDQLQLQENYIAVPGFYSLERENRWKDDVGATPDGRRQGEPFSENQSPTYGADKSGITALLKSLSKLPFHRAVSGGLNLTFSRPVDAQTLRALVQSYFQMGGLHVGITVLDRQTLLDAMEHPEKHQALTVRLYGFSEYFISLPKWQQIAVLNRTAYSSDAL